MKVFGYEKDSENLIELKQVSIQSDIEELDKVIKFLQNVKDQHSKVIGENKLCCSHFRDWDVEWKSGLTDIIVVTNSNSE